MTFKKGQSGNPGGRKPGPARVSVLRDQIAKEIPDILSALTAQAKAGDVQAARLLLERVVPPVKPETRALPVGTAIEPGAIVDALTAGALTTEQAREVMGVLADRAKIGEAVENAERLARIEAMLTQAKN